MEILILWDMIFWYLNLISWEKDLNTVIIYIKIEIEDYKYELMTFTSLCILPTKLFKIGPLVE